MRSSNPSAQALGACKPTYTPAMFKAELQLLSGKARLDALTEPHQCCVEGCTAPPIGVGTLPDDNDYSALTLCAQHARGVEAGESVSTPVLAPEDASEYINQAYLNQLRALVEHGDFPFFARTPAALSGVLGNGEGMIVLVVDGKPGVIPFAMPYEAGDPFFTKSLEITMLAEHLIEGASLTMMMPSPGRPLAIMEASKENFMPFPDTQEAAK